MNFLLPLLCLRVAVGQTLKVKKGKETKSITIKERPKSCALCPCKSGFHAMHPLYDKSGPGGQPLLGRDDAPIWVHTLCAVFICGYTSSKGFVYGCDESGRYEEATSDRESQDEDSSQESTDLADAYNNFAYYENEEEVLTAAPHHFIITSGADKASAETLRFMEERRDLKCSVCKNPDMQSRRLVVQVILCCYTMLLFHSLCLVQLFCFSYFPWYL